MNSWTPASVPGDAGPVSYAEFMRSESLSAGIYRLAAGSSDPQKPHQEDEIYCVLSGRGRLRVEDKLYDLAPRSISFVAAGASHRFEDIVEDLTLLVVFAPPETDID